MVDKDNKGIEVYLLELQYVLPETVGELLHADAQQKPT
jgi:hypothetical protein